MSKTPSLLDTLLKLHFLLKEKPFYLLQPVENSLWIFIYLWPASGNASWESADGGPSAWVPDVNQGDLLAALAS